MPANAGDERRGPLRFRGGGVARASFPLRPLTSYSNHAWYKLGLLHRHPRRLRMLRMLRGSSIF
jgi:hypothetical protein